MSNLLLHSGTEEVSYDQLKAVETPPATRTWTPIPHVELLDAVKREVTQSGLVIQEETFGLGQAKSGRYGDRFFGLLQIRGNGGDYALMIGVRNSNDFSMPAGLCVGSACLVCDNLAFSAEIVVSRRHTRRIRRDLPRLINDAVGQLGDLRDRQGRRIEAYQNTPITDTQFHDLAVRAMDAKVVCASAIPKVLSEYREPRHAEFEPRVVWSAFNAFTEVLKTCNLQDLPRRTQALHGLCDLLSRLN